MVKGRGMSAGAGLLLLGGYHPHLAGLATFDAIMVKNRQELRGDYKLITVSKSVPWKASYLL